MLRNLLAFILWLSTAAFPVQGFAAIGMPPCVAAPSASVADAGLGRVSAVTMHGHRVAPDVGVRVQANEAGHGQAVAIHGSSEISAPDAGHAGHSGHSTLKCCSAGCSMAACAALGLATHSRMRSLAPVQSEANFYPDVILDGLDRPPRLLLA